MRGIEREQCMFEYMENVSPNEAENIRKLFRIC